MPITSLSGSAEEFTAKAAKTPRTPRIRLVAIDPLLRVDPLLEVSGLSAARLRALPRLVRLFRLSDELVDDAEIDERLGRLVAQPLELAQLFLAERERGLVDDEPPLL